jgi:YD repeat-containing protein
MKNLNILLGLVIGLSIICCSSNNSENNNSQKKLTKITYITLGGGIRLVQNLIYDTNGNLIEIIDDEGFVTTTYSYNNSNLLVKKVDYQDNDDDTSFEIIKNISYNNENKISNIEELFNVYHLDGSLYYQNLSNKKVSYGNNFITTTSDALGNNTVEFTLTNNLITRAKLIQYGNLVADMAFTYDDEGNCISGSGPYEPGLYDTNDIDLSVIYRNEEKNHFFNTFFDYNILYNNDSFFVLKEALINQQGTKYPEKIQWYQFNGWTYKESIDYSFDSDGYIISKKTNIFSQNPGEIINYTWE